MSTVFTQTTEAEKVKSGILFVNHLQSNNPVLLSPAEGVRLIQSRSALFINTYKPFFVLIKKVKAFFNVTTEVAESDDAVSMLKSFDADFFGYISAIKGKKGEIITNSYNPQFNIPSAQTKTDTSQTITQNKNTFVAPHDFVFNTQTEIKANDASQNLSANYFLPVPQALSRYQERSDVIPLSVELTDYYEKVYFKAGQYFLVANFASNILSHSLDPAAYTDESFINGFFGTQAPKQKVVSQHGVQFWVEIYTEN